MKYIALLTFALIVIGCGSDSSDSSGPAQANNSTGESGSLARFTIVNDYLYVVDEFDLNVFSITDTENPVLVNKVDIGFNIETLFSYKNYLYIGSRDGMFIYNISNAEIPEKLAAVEHFTACDPVIANSTHAFVTLHSESICGNNVNLLEIYDVADITNPKLISSRSLIKPVGIGLFGNYLFVCDDEIKIFDVSDPANSTISNTIAIEGFDVIISNNLLYVIAESGLYQYQLDPDDIQNITELSSIIIQNPS